MYICIYIHRDIESVELNINGSSNARNRANIPNIRNDMYCRLPKIYRTFLRNVACNFGFSTLLIYTYIHTCVYIFI